MLFNSLSYSLTNAVWFMRQVEVVAVVALIY